MNAWQIKALMEWYKMLERSAKATEQGSDFDSQLQAWTDPRKKHQYPYDTVHDPLTPRGWQVETSENLPPGGVNYIKRRDKGMSDRENMRLLSEELERLERSESQHRAWSKERASTQPSALERADIAERERVLSARPAPTTGTLQGELESAEIPTTPSLPVPSTENLLQYRTREGFHTSPYKRYPGTLSSYSIPERGIEPPDIHVDPSGEARIMSDYYDSIVNYRKSKTGEVDKYMESFDPAEQARRLEGAEQAIPDRGLPENVPEWALIQQEQIKAERYQASEANKKRVARLRAVQAGKTSKFDELVKRYRRAAGKRYRELKRGRGRGGLPFNPKIWDRSLIPAGGPTDAFKRMMDRRSR